MKIDVKVITNAGINRVEKNEDNSYLVRTTASPVDGKANNMVIKILADYFSIRKSVVTLISGDKNRHKIFEIDL